MDRLGSTRTGLSNWESSRFTVKYAWRNTVKPQLQKMREEHGGYDSTVQNNHKCDITEVLHYYKKLRINNKRVHHSI